MKLSELAAKDKFKRDIDKLVNKGDEVYTVDELAHLCKAEPRKVRYYLECRYPCFIKSHKRYFGREELVSKFK